MSLPPKVVEVITRDVIDLTVLKTHGLTEENLRDWLEGDPLGKQPDKSLKAVRVAADATEEQRMNAASITERRQGLLNRIRSRCQEGRDRNFANYRHFHALDVAWDAPFRQITPTMVASFMQSNPNDESVYKQIVDWGLTELITETPDPKTPSKTVKSFNFPVFFQVLVPLVKSYVTIRWAKIMNDRRLTPFFKFEPVKMTTEIGLKCDVITDRIQIMSLQYGYFDVMKQAVLKMLQYSVCIQFPTKEWDYEEQLRLATDEDVALKKTKLDADGKEVPVVAGDEIKVTVREGLGYHLPHPSRTYVDLAHPAYTINYGYGVEYGGYWRIIRYRNVLHSNFWNKEKIALGSVDLVAGNSLFFNTVYTACQLTVPCATATTSPDGNLGAAAMGVGAGALDREKEIAVLYYGTEHLDQGVLITEHFEKLIPKDNGLGTYPCPVWFRFVLAGDGCTVLYAAPLPYDPMIYYGYDADESRSKNASLSMEVLPFQDQFSNVLSQIILTAKQNLANITFVDEAQLTEDAKKKISNLGEGYYRFLNVFGYDSKKAFRGQNRVSDAVQSANLPKGNTAELINVLKTILDVLERVLVMSSQEVGQAASHEQTREEIRNITANTSSRLVFTSTPVDIARDSWKRQLYCGLMAYGDDDIYAQIPSEIPLTKDQLQAMGFSYVDKDTATGTYGSEATPTTGSTNRTAKIKYVRIKTTKKATAIPLWEISSTRDGDDRIDKERIAVSMATILDKLISNPLTAQAIGPDQAIEMTNAICQLAGLPRDVKFRNMSPNLSPEQQQEQAAAEMKQVVDIVLKQVTGEMQAAIEPLVKETSKNSEDIALVMNRLSLLLQSAGIPVNQLNDQPQSQPALT